MSIKTKEMISDLKLLIDISSADQKHLKLFDNFHKKLIRIAYHAIGIRIDYERKRVNMHVLVDETKGEFLERFDEGMQDIMVVNLSYRELNEFLTSCIVLDMSNFQNYYNHLRSEFFKSERIDASSPTFQNNNSIQWGERLTS